MEDLAESIVCFAEVMKKKGSLESVGVRKKRKREKERKRKR